ncbi:MAG: regulator [Candidatus Dormibacteraeota bacterium]|nr:regulator [Candidatus Dormibacteraeota bacterium]
MSEATVSTRRSAPAPVRFWVPGDLNAFFGLGTNVMLNVIVLTGLCLYVLRFSPGNIVYGSILPALGIALPLGNLWYAFLAYRLAQKENRDTVAAMPYGPSVPHMFLVVFVVMLPTLLKTKDPVKAWEAGLAWAFIIGVIILLGAFVGPTVRKYTPRAAMLGTLAGISITFISMQPAARMYLAPVVALAAFAIILIGWTANIRLPWNLPAGLVAVLLGTLIGWVMIFTGTATKTDMQLSPLSDAFKFFGFHAPNIFNVPHLVNGLADIGPLLVTAIPLGVYNFTEGMNNVESASAAGDSYNLRYILGADGIGALVGSALGSPFPPAVYIGHPGWKAAGGRIGYSLATGIFVAVICFLGLVQLFLAVFPIQALYPILLFIGLVIGAQAFQTTPRAHAAGVVLALIPNIANWAQGQIDNAFAAANLLAGGSGAGHVPIEAMAANGVYYAGLVKLGGGAVLAGLVLGAIAVFIIDREFVKAAIYAFAGAVLSFFGFIHAGSLACTGAGCNFGPTWAIATGYLVMAAIALAFAYVFRVAAAPHPLEESAAEVEGGLQAEPLAT